MGNNEKWFEEAVEGGRTKNLDGWSKGLKATTRRRRALASRPDNWSLCAKRLSAARALQALANVTQDDRTEEVAQRDANYFFKLYDKYCK